MLCTSETSAALAYSLFQISVAQISICNEAGSCPFKAIYSGLLPGSLNWGRKMVVDHIAIMCDVNGLDNKNQSMYVSS